MSVKFLSAILGPEMGASILWTPGKMRSFCRKNPCPLGGGGYFGFFFGGGSADFIFMGARILPLKLTSQKQFYEILRADLHGRRKQQGHARSGQFSV